MADNENLNEEQEEDLNETFEEEMDDATVITVPIDDTLSNQGEAADAKAVGDALALKADRTELQTAITVNGQSADLQGAIIVRAGDISMSGTDATTVSSRIGALEARTGAAIAVSTTDATTIAAKLTAIDGKTADDILFVTGGSSILEVIQSMFPVGAIYMTTSATAPTFFGTWTEVLMPFTHDALKSGTFSYVNGSGTGNVHFYLRTA
jgi:hypothetical protein